MRGVYPDGNRVVEVVVLKTVSHTVGAKPLYSTPLAHERIGVGLNVLEAVEDRSQRFLTSEDAFVDIVAWTQMPCIDVDYANVVLGPQ